MGLPCVYSVPHGEHSDVSLCYLALTPLYSLPHAHTEMHTRVYAPHACTHAHRNVTNVNQGTTPFLLTVTSRRIARARTSRVCDRGSSNGTCRRALRRQLLEVCAVAKRRQHPLLVAGVEGELVDGAVAHVERAALLLAETQHLLDE